MMKRIAFGLLMLTSGLAWADPHYPGLQVAVQRDGGVYSFTAKFDSPLSKCAAYRYLTDNEAAKELPGMVESLALRESASKVKVERTVDEHVLFVTVRLRSVMEYTERPYDGLALIQLTGDSKSFRGNWHIEANPTGSTLSFQGTWQPDSMIPLFIIDHFAQNGLLDRFSDIARMGEQRKDKFAASCANTQYAKNGEQVLP